MDRKQKVKNILKDALRGYEKGIDLNSYLERYAVMIIEDEPKIEKKGGLK